jgi:hypothetical protein
MSPEAKPAPLESRSFGPDPSYEDKPYDADEQLRIYGGKSAVRTPRPLLELGRPQYSGGPYEPAGTAFGEKNPTDQAFMIYGDWRTAAARNQNGGNSRNILATRLNLDVDWKLTANERLHAFFRPLDHGTDFTRCERVNGAPTKCERAMDLKPETLFFEGDRRLARRRVHRPRLQPAGEEQPPARHLEPRRHLLRGGRRRGYGRRARRGRPPQQPRRSYLRRDHIH